jgi:hypothetical protein
MDVPWACKLGLWWAEGKALG